MHWSYFSSFLTIEIGTADDYCYPTSLISRSFLFCCASCGHIYIPFNPHLFLMWRSRVPSWPSFQMSCWFPCSPAIVWCFHFFTHYIPPSMLQHLPLDDPSCVYLNLPSVAKKMLPRSNPTSVADPLPQQNMFPKIRQLTIHPTIHWWSSHVSYLYPPRLARYSYPNPPSLSC